MDAFEADFENRLALAVVELDSLMPIASAPFARPSPEEAIDAMAVLTANTAEYHSQWQAYTTNDKLCSHLLDFVPVSGYEMAVEDMDTTLMILQTGFDQTVNMMRQCLRFLATVDALELCNNVVSRLLREPWYANPLTNFTHKQYHAEWNAWLTAHSWELLQHWCWVFDGDLSFFYTSSNLLIDPMAAGLTTIVDHYAQLVARGSTAQTMVVQAEGCRSLYSLRPGMTAAVTHHVAGLKKAYQQTMKKAQDFNQQCRPCLDSLLSFANAASQASVYHNPANALYKKAPTVRSLFWSPNFGIYRTALLTGIVGAAAAGGWAAYNGAQLRRARAARGHPGMLSKNSTAHG